jgi:hypothetical protein
MSKVRITYNFDFIRSLPNNIKTAHVVLNEANRMKSGIEGEGGEARVDSQFGGSRFRAAVIAGYEDGAHAENTRRQLLRNLGSADG